MATRAIKAQRRAQAQQQLNDLVGKIATEYGIERPAVPLVRDPEYRAVYDLEADLVVLQAFYERTKTSTWTTSTKPIPTRQTAKRSQSQKTSPPRPSPSQPLTVPTPQSPQAQTT